MLQPDDIAHVVTMLVTQSPQSFASEIVLRPTLKAVGGREVLRQVPGWPCLDADRQNALLVISQGKTKRPL